MPKFILIDSNIAGMGGHYLEYAEQILQVAEQRGFECILAANNAFSPAATSPRYSSRSIFPFDMWGRNLSRGRQAPDEFTADDRRYLRDYYSLAGLLWNASAALSVTRHYSQQTTLPSALARRLRQVHAARIKVEALEGAQDDDEQPHSEAENRALRYRRFRQTLARSAAGSVPTHAEYALLADLVRQSRAADTYGAAIARLLTEAAVGADDHIFIPTLSLAEARSIRDLMRRDERARQPHWSLLFRRDVYHGYSSEWPKQDWSVHEARNLFASFLPLTRSVRLSFFTDTDLLTKQYDKLGSVPFHTTAIPVRSTERARSTEQPDAPWEVLVLTGKRSPASLTMFIETIECLDRKDFDRMHFLIPADAFEDTIETNGVIDGRSSARARLRPFLPDAITIGGSAQELKETLSHVDACVLIDLQPDSLVHLGVGSDQFHGMPVLAPPAVAQWLTRKSDATVFEYSLGQDEVAGLVEALRRIAEGPRRARNEQRHLRIGYLGDARAEKGFHLLPEIMDGLNRSRNDGQRFYLETQVYHPNPESDIRMLRAMERIRRMPADRASIVEGALDSSEYQGIISRTDVIFNVYARHNYVSRSSGVFVEALASLKPVLTTAGTWMSALMGDWSQAYHDRALRQSTVLWDKTFGEVDDWYFLGEPKPGRSSTDFMLDLKPGLSACSSEKIPLGANHVRIQVCTLSPFSDAPLNLIVAWQNDAELTKIELKRQLNRTTPGVISSVFPVPKDARHLWIGLSITGHVQSCPIEWARVTWHAIDEGVAEMPGGIAVTDGLDAKLVEDCVAALRAIELSYSAYAESCAWVFDQWTHDQNAAALFNDLVNPHSICTGINNRFIGREW